MLKCGFRRALFSPLLTFDRFCQQSKRPRLHTNYLKTGEQQLEAMPQNTDALTSVGGIFNGSGGLVGSMADYMKFAIMLTNKGIGANGARILGPRSVEHMSMNHLPGGV